MNEFYILPCSFLCKDIEKELKEKDAIIDQYKKALERKEKIIVQLKKISEHNCRKAIKYINALRDIEGSLYARADHDKELAESIKNIFQ